MKNVNIMRIHQFLGEGGSKEKQYILGIALKGAWAICRRPGKNKEESVLEGELIPPCTL